ncbi:MAG TPA: hypothetical protein VGO47_12385, partial [Chlamydiales bacterium]|nr:hypothetical protein [Chlamydiales bacterium]
IEAIQAKFDNPSIDLLELPVSYIHSLSSQEYKDIKLSMKEQIFVKKNLRDFFKSAPKKQARHEYYIRYQLERSLTVQH